MNTENLMKLITFVRIFITLEGGNYWAYSHPIKFIGFILPCRCAMNSLFAHRAHFDLPRGMKLVCACVCILDFVNSLV